MVPTDPLVLLQLWGVRTASVPAAIGRMATHRLSLRRQPGLRFAKMLGTGDGRTFTVRDADPLHWGLLTVWEENARAARFYRQAKMYPECIALMEQNKEAVLRSIKPEEARCRAAVPP